MVETDWTADEHFDNILNNLKALNGKLFFCFIAKQFDLRKESLIIN